MDSTNHPDSSRNISTTPKSDNTSSTEDEGQMALPTDSMQVRAEKLQERIRLALKRQKVAGKDELFAAFPRTNGELSIYRTYRLVQAASTRAQSARNAAAEEFPHFCTQPQLTQVKFVR